MEDCVWLGRVTYVPFRSQANAEEGRYPSKAEMKANARLIAKAPELRDELAECVSVLKAWAKWLDTRRIDEDPPKEEGRAEWPGRTHKQLEKTEALLSGLERTT